MLKSLSRGWKVVPVIAIAGALIGFSSTAFAQHGGGHGGGGHAGGGHAGGGHAGGGHVSHGGAAHHSGGHHYGGVSLGIGGFYGSPFGIGFGGFPGYSSFGYSRPYPFYSSPYYSSGAYYRPSVPSYSYNNYGYSYSAPRMIVVPSQPATVVRTPQVVDVNTYKGDLKPGMVLSDGAVVVSVGPSVPAAETVVPASK